MIIWITKKEKLWSILSSMPSASTRNPTVSEEAKELEEEKTKHLMYILNMSIKPSLLAQLTKYQEPSLLWNFLCQSFEVDNDSRKFELKNRLFLLFFFESLGVESYFS